MSEQKLLKTIEVLFETILWKSRLITLLAVVFGVLAALGLFFLGSYEIYKTLSAIFHLVDNGGTYEYILIGIVGAIDLYLIGIVLLLFSFGIYELFISKIDAAKFDKDINILEIKSLDELKNKVLKVIVVVLVVTLFKHTLTMKFVTPMDVLSLALTIVAVAVAVYLLRKKEDS